MSYSENLDRTLASIRNLLGNEIRPYYETPCTLPEGINYTKGEWDIIKHAISTVRNTCHIDVHLVLCLEEIENRYKSYLFLGKFESL